MSRSPLVPDPDGTATDPATGLVWMIPLLGESWGGAGPLEPRTPVELSWSDATGHFGRGRHIAATSMDCNWKSEGTYGTTKTPYHLKYPLRSETYTGYAVGSREVYFAGFRDWRLPTVEELWTLGEAGIPDVMAVGRDHLWTANPSTRGFLAGLAMTHAGAWMFQISRPPQAFGDMRRNLQLPVRLVRGGSIFQATF